jgi:hypothetical protein
MHVLAEVVEVLPGTRMVDLQKVQGNTGEGAGGVLPAAVWHQALTSSSVACCML